MAKVSFEVKLLRDWYASQKASRDHFTLKDAAAELTERRGWTVYPHQVCNWLKHGAMGPATRRLVREALSPQTKRAS